MWCQMYIAEQFPSCLATPDAMLDVHTTISLHLLHSFFAVSWRARGRRWLPPPPPPLRLISSMFRFIPQKSNVSPLTPLFFLASPQFTSWSWPSSSFFCLFLLLASSISSLTSSYTPFSFYSSVLLSLLSFNSACHPPILTLSSLSHPSSILCSPLHSSPVSSLYSLLHSSSFHRSNIALFFLFST